MSYADESYIKNPSYIKRMEEKGACLDETDMEYSLSEIGDEPASITLHEAYVWKVHLHDIGNVTERVQPGSSTDQENNRKLS